ncbi:MAG: Cold shock protein CspB [Pseudomonadota bacterium]
MPLPSSSALTTTQVYFRNFPVTMALRTLVYQRVLHIQRTYGRILSCSISASTAHRRHRVGNPINVRVSIQFPRGQVITTYAESPSLAQPNLQMALRDAFLAARKQLRRQIDRRRGRELAGRGVGLRALDQESRRLASASDESWRRAPTRARAKKSSAK